MEFLQLCHPSASLLLSTLKQEGVIIEYDQNAHSFTSPGDDSCALRLVKWTLICHHYL